MFNFAEKTSDMTAIEILNYYRNLYYAEPRVAERGIVANAINDTLDLINRQRAEVEHLEQENKVYNEANRLIAFQRDRRDEEIEELHRQITGLDIALKAMRGAANSYKAESERYKRYYYRHEYEKWEKEIKTEAYQEFAKFLIDKSSKGLLRTSRLPDYVKEMVGEEE